MTNNLAELLDSRDKMATIAKEILQICKGRAKKEYSHTRNTVSFLFRRSLEIFETLTILIRAGRIVDSALMLRSLVEMGISLGYIFAKDIDELENEKRALRYLLNGDKQQRDLLKANLEEFKKSDSNIEKRLDELNDHLKQMEEDFKNKYKDENWKLPCIKQRAVLSNYKELLEAYNLSYRDLSNIEHHNFLFGQHYVDDEKCEPKVEISLPKELTQFRPIVILAYSRALFLNMLSVFNDEFHLGRERQITELRSLQDKEFALLKE